MTQQPLITKPAAGKKTPIAVAAQFDAANLHAAHAILASPEKWGGKDSFYSAWARAVVARIGSQPSNVSRVDA